MKIVFLYNIGRSIRLEGVRHKSHPTEFFYGAMELEQQGHDVSIVEIDPKSGASLLSTFINFFSQKGFLPDKVSGNLLVAISKHHNALQEADCIVASTTGLAFSTSMLPSLRNIPLVGIHCGLLNNPSGLVKQKLRTFFIKRMDTILFGKGECAGVLSWNRRLKDRVHVCDFGVDTTFWHPPAQKKSLSESPYVLSVGNDERRDFGTLVKAAANIKCDVRILTQRSLPKTLPPNVTVLRGGWHNKGLTDLELREQYQGASCVLLPLSETQQPSGQSVALQAMACGSPVIMSLTEGIWSKSKLKHGENVLFFSPGDFHELSSKTNMLLDDFETRMSISSKGLRLVKDNWTIEDFASGVEQVCKIALSRSSHR